MTHTHEELMTLADSYAADQYARATLSDALRQVVQEIERLKKQVIRAANFELDLLRALDGQVTLCGFEEIAEVEKLKADNLDLRRDEALNEAEDLIRQALQALLPHKSTALRWYTPVDATIDAINRYLND